MYVYIKSEPNLWTVGYYNPKGDWIPESDHDSKESASSRVHYLNGQESIEHINELIYQARNPKG